ncbi:MAG: hypothetical protein SFY66_26325 [Oculatellaceae cyanobacterium bins.114]|nr:hypothetical protein [Oculatellaceae cyanobacterium bins.114]
MQNPVQRLKLIPWRDLLHVAGLALLLATFLDTVLAYLHLKNALVGDIFDLLLTPPLAVIMFVAVFAGVGALAVFLMERCFRQLIINTANLWALVLCLIIVIAIKAVLPIPSLLLQADQASLMGLIVGVFLTSWKYWRYSSGGGCCR